jgi:3'(2'), 5'-bisphosphate nucleotidase
MNELLALARRAATEAGKAILAHYGTEEFELKEDNSPVTKADTEANTILMRVLKESGIPILSEETLDIALPYPERLWVVDPLDGTKGFLKHTDDFSVMIGLIHHGRPVLAVVYAPVSAKCYFATEGGGSFLDEGGATKRLHVSTRTSPTLRGLVSVNHAAPYMFDVCRMLDVSEEVAVGSIGIKAGYIAENRADFYLTRGALGEWDVCAPELILSEAGGHVTDERGEELFYGAPDHRIAHGVIFSNSACHDEVRNALASVDK